MSLKGKAVRHFINMLKEGFDPLNSAHYQMIIPKSIDIKDSSLGKALFGKYLYQVFFLKYGP